MAEYAEKTVGPIPMTDREPMQGVSMETIIAPSGEATGPERTSIALAVGDGDIGVQVTLHRRDRPGKITDAQCVTLARLVPAMADAALRDIGAAQRAETLAAAPSAVGAGSHPRPSEEEQELPYEVQQGIVVLFEQGHKIAEDKECALARHVRDPGLVYTLWEDVSYHDSFESATLKTLAEYVADVMLAHGEIFIKMNLRAVASLLAHLADDDSRFATIVRLVDGTQIVNVVLYYEREEYLDACDALIPAITDTAALTAIALDIRQEDDTRACAIRHISDAQTLKDIIPPLDFRRDSKHLAALAQELLQQI